MADAKDWFDVPFLQFLSRETTSAVAAVLSYAIVGFAVTRFVSNPWLHAVIESSEGFILALIFLLFPMRVAYYVYREAKRRAGR